LSNLVIEPIGQIRTIFKDKFGTPRQPGLVSEALGFIKIDPKWQPEQALMGLEKFSHLWIVFHFHLNKVANYHAKVHPPRLNGQSLGLFATRTPHRPNPIGLSLVQIIRVDKDGVLVSGVDLVDGTPVFDIKPYLPDVECQNQAQAGWVSQVDSKKELRFDWPEAVLSQLNEWFQNLQNDVLSSNVIKPDDLRKTVENVISLDPRPLVYKGYEGQESPFREEHAVRLWNGDVHFKFVSQDSVELCRIVWISS
jgi:tRNA (adenine37-N6)-methyltransferase